MKLTPRLAALLVLAAPLAVGGDAARADALPPPAGPGAVCGTVTHQWPGLSAGVQELTTGTLDCVVNGTRDVLSGVSGTLGQPR